MPNFDAGHYFLTVLAPIRTDSILIGEQSHSHPHLIRDVLARMPTGERTAVSRGNAVDNPFARTTRTHFARFVVLDDVVFNGRVSGDSLVALLRGTNPLTPQKADTLSTPFLIFCADFDAPSGDDSALRDYAAVLWQSMEIELTAVFQHCVGFDNIRTAGDFHNYIKRCQIETTMPFNDYWSTPPALTAFSYIPYAVAAGVALIVLVLGLFGGGWLFWLGLLALIIVIVVGVKALIDKAQQPFPTSPPPGPGSDLPTVLKALSVQREFTAFAIAAQSQDDQALHVAFGEFLASTKPNDFSTATQPPGVIGV